MIITEEKRNQIVSYIVHAGEILQKENHFPKHSYKYAYLPIWSELYTGTLKAAGYLFLDKTLNNIIFLIEQTEYPKEIISYIDETKLLILWRSIKNKSIPSKNNQPVSREIFEQLLYIRLLTKVTSVTILGIGTKITKKQITEEINNIGYSDYWIIVLGKASENNKSELSKMEDIKMIENMMDKKTYKENASWLGNIYTDIIKKHKGKPELVAYVHSSDLWIKTIKQIWYICMVA